MERENTQLFEACIDRARSIGRIEFIISNGTFSLVDCVKIDMLEMLLFIAMQDGSIEKEEIDFINYLLDYSFTKEQAENYVKKHALHSDDLLRTTPKSLSYYVKNSMGIDLTLGIKYYDLKQLYCSAFHGIGREMIACNRKLSSEKIDALTKYGMMLELRIKEIEEQAERERLSVAFPTGAKHKTMASRSVAKEQSDATLDRRNIVGAPPKKEESKKMTLDTSRNSEQNATDEDVVFTGKIVLRNEEKTFEMLYNELMGLIGLESVKKEVGSLINLLKISKIRQENGLAAPDVQKNMVFLGNPGTGKTTVARIIAEMYGALGILSKGQYVEVDRSGLVAGYMGQTAQKVKDVIERAIGGVLFIDEAYALSNNKMEGDFGQEAIDILNKMMEDNRDDLVVIVAGYEDEMQTFLDANPGLRSRFNRTISFPDYEADELFEILIRRANIMDYMIDPSAISDVKEYIESITNQKEKNFGNARWIRNFLDDAIARQANRLMEASMDGTMPEHSELITLKRVDFLG